MSYRQRIWVTILGLGLLAFPSMAQTDRATLEGTVTDASGGTISGAKISITAVDTGLSYERETNSSGYFRFPGMAIGVYTATVSTSGFKTRTMEGVQLQTG